jgi:hypothetical protein
MAVWKPVEAGRSFAVGLTLAAARTTAERAWALDFSPFALSSTRYHPTDSPSWADRAGDHR